MQTNKIYSPEVAVVAPKRILSIGEIQRITGKSRSTVYRWVSLHLLPPPINIGPNSIGWPEEVINEWRENLINGEV